MRPNYEFAKKSALDILNSQGLIEPPVNPVEIARNMGVSVYFITFEDANISEKVSGFYDPGEDAIYVNEKEFPKRQTFTVAHELGHRMMHREWASSNDYKMLLRQDANNYINSEDAMREKEANVFAAHLLVPRSMLNAYYDLASPEKLSDLFAVSIEMLKNRLSFEYGIR
jgi:Zn-dependent peptidase ImmA (M78 family)